MMIDMRLTGGMAGLEGLGRELAQACLRLELSPRMTGWVVAAGMGAGSAVILGGGGEPRLVLDKGLSQVTLSVTYQPPPLNRGAVPPGLAAGLFSPPAKKVSQGDDEGRAVWAAVWEE